MATLDAKQVWFVEATIVSNMGLIFIQKMTVAKIPMGVVVGKTGGLSAFVANPAVEENGRETDIAKALDALIQHNPKKDFVILTHAHFSKSPHSHFL